MTVLPHHPTHHELLLEAQEAQRQLREAEAEAEQRRAVFRAAVARAHAAGIVMRAIAPVLGISFRRVQQIVDGERRRPRIAIDIPAIEGE